MLNVKKLLTKMLLSTTREDIASGTLSANDYSSSSKTITRAGYRPIGVIGFDPQNTYVFVSRVELISASIGSGTISYTIRNTSGGSSNYHLYVDVLWRPA